MILTLLLFILVLGILIFVHEFGHFISAKKSGAIVEEFGFGFPPRLVGIKRGGTIYSLNWLPVGGFVRIAGENGEGPIEPGMFMSLAWWKRFVVIASGVVMNILLAWVLFTTGFLIGAPTALDGPLPHGATVRDKHVQIVQVYPGSAAEKVAMQGGDSILSIDGITMDTTEQVQEYNAAHADVQEIVVLQHGKSMRSVTITPTVASDSNGKAVWGIGLADTGVVHLPWYTAIWLGAARALAFFWQIALSFVLLFRDLIVHHSVSAELSGPVGIAVMTGQAASLGFVYILNFMALLSLNLAFINVLPLPALDGGRLLFLIIERIRGKRVSGHTESIVHFVGFAVLLCVVLLVTVKDITHYIPSISTFFGNIVHNGK